MNKPWIAVSAVLLLAAPVAYADVGQGDFEAGISVALTYTEVDVEGTTFDQDAGLVGLSGGYFITDQLEAKVSLLMIVTSDFTAGTVAPGVDYLFTGDNASTVVPFAGAAFGLGVADNETDVIDIHGGVKYFFRENTSVDAKLTYSSPTDSAYSSTTDLTVGINIYF